ncbi:hypothetical protein [Paracoccus sp. PAMC 22219]|uniref:hypothetical protein n=1 Tax=Paracoccus sp. PAMC 22219 TaxID=1569209 RepID=UPI0018CDFBFC|nr:hypothetical protein [Paracoccus sp. PAMC 22219]
MTDSGASHRVARDAAAPTVEVSHSMVLTLPDRPETQVAMVAVRGDRDLALKVHPPGSPLTAGPDGVRIASGTGLRCTLPPAAYLHAKAILLEISFSLHEASACESLLSLIDANGRSLSFRDMGAQWVVRAGAARMDLVSHRDHRQTVCFVLTAGGHLIMRHDDGLIEDAAAFDPVDILQLRQIRVGDRGAMTLHALRLQALQNGSRDDLRAWMSSWPSPGGDAGAGSPLLIHFNGQSLAVGPDVPPGDRLALADLGRPDVQMLGGVHTGPDRRPVDLQGLQTRPGPVDAADAVMAQVRIAGPMPPALAMAQALSGQNGGDHDQLRLAPVAVSGSPVFGQSIAVLDDPDGLVRYNMDQIIDATHLAYARQGIAPADVVYFWIQGEADRQAPPGAYLAALSAHWDRIRSRLDDLYPAARKMILLMQTAGSDQSHHGSDTTHTATEQLAFAAGRDDAVMVGPIYPSALSDRVHPDLHHSRIIGELAAWALRETMAGRGWTIPRPTARRQGDRITLRFALRPDEALAAHTESPYGGMGIDEFLGVEVIGGGAITALALDGHDLHLTVDGPITGLRYAMQRQNMRIDGNAHSARRGLLRTTLSRPAVHLPGTMLYRWLPGFVLDADAWA